MIAVSVSERGPVSILSVSGMLTLPHDPRRVFKKAAELAAQGRTLVVLDLSQVEWIDSSGLGTLVQSWNALREANGKLVVVVNTRRLVDALRTTRLEELLNRFDNVDAAVAYLSKP